MSATWSSGQPLRCCELNNRPESARCTFPAFMQFQHRPEVQKEPCGCWISLRADRSRVRIGMGWGKGCSDRLILAGRRRLEHRRWDDILNILNGNEQSDVLYLFSLGHLPEADPEVRRVVDQAEIGVRHSDEHDYEDHEY